MVSGKKCQLNYIWLVINLTDIKRKKFQHNKYIYKKIWHFQYIEKSCTFCYKEGRLSFPARDCPTKVYPAWDCPSKGPLPALLAPTRYLLLYLQPKPLPRTSACLPTKVKLVCMSAYLLYLIPALPAGPLPALPASTSRPLSATCCFTCCRMGLPRPLPATCCSACCRPACGRPPMAFHRLPGYIQVIKW